MCSKFKGLCVRAKNQNQNKRILNKLSGTEYDISDCKLSLLVSFKDKVCRAQIWNYICKSAKGFVANINLQSLRQTKGFGKGQILLYKSAC